MYNIFIKFFIFLITNHVIASSDFCRGYHNYYKISEEDHEQYCQSFNSLSEDVQTQLGKNIPFSDLLSVLFSARKQLALAGTMTSDDWGTPRKAEMNTPGRMYFYMRSRMAELLKIIANAGYLKKPQRFDGTDFTIETAREKASDSYARIQFRIEEQTQTDYENRSFICPKTMASLWPNKDEFMAGVGTLNSENIGYCELLQEIEANVINAQKEADVKSNGTYFASIRIIKKTPLGDLPGQNFQVVFHKEDLLNTDHDWSLNPWILTHIPVESINQYNNICSSLYNDLLMEVCAERKKELLTELLYYFHTATFAARGSAAMGEMLEKAFFGHFGWAYQQRTFSLVDQLTQVSFGFSGFKKKYYTLNGWDIGSKEK